MNFSFENHKETNSNDEVSPENNIESYEKESENIFTEIQERLNSFIEPDMSLIDLAKTYISQLRKEGAKEENERDGAFSGNLKKKLVKKFGGCVGCGGGSAGGSSRHDPVLQPHHITPREFGGKTTSNNAMIVCRDCHVIIHS